MCLFGLSVFVRKVKQFGLHLMGTCTFIIGFSLFSFVESFVINSKPISDISISYVSLLVVVMLFIAGFLLYKYSDKINQIIDREEDD